MALIAALLFMVLIASFLMQIRISRLQETLSETLRTLNQIQDGIQGISQHLYRSQNKSNYNAYETIL